MSQAGPAWSHLVVGASLSPSIRYLSEYPHRRKRPLQQRLAA